jgi:AcrR family transcriptional regulator
MISDIEILEAAIFVFANKPDATMSEVARQARVTRITINRKFGTKDKLLKKSAQYSVKHFDRILKKAMSGRKPPMEKFFSIMREYYRLRHHYFFWMRMMVDDDDKNRQLFLRQLEKIEKLVVIAQENGEVRADLPPGWVASFFDYVIVMATMSRYRGLVAERDILDVAWNTFLYGVAPQKLF